MGYNGKGPIGKCKEGVTKPIELPSQLSRDKIGLGYKLTFLLRKIPRKNPKPQWKAKKKYKEEYWQEALFELVETIYKDREHQEQKQHQEKLLNHKKAIYAAVAHIQTPISKKAELPPDIIIPPWE